MESTKPAMTTQDGRVISIGSTVSGMHEERLCDTVMKNVRELKALGIFLQNLDVET